MRRFKPALLIATVFVVLIVASLIAWRVWQPQPKARVSTLVVEPQAQQTIKGWGIYPCTFEINRVTPDLFTIFKRPNAQRLILRELGVSFVRANILPRSYDAKRDALDVRYLDATLVRQLKMAQRFGHSRYLLTVWSPPAVFKNPPITFGQAGGKISKLRPDREADYCRFVVRVLDFLTKSRGLKAPIAYSIQNEPSYAPAQWDATAYDAIQWQRVLVRMRRALDDGGYKRVSLVGPECGDYARCVAFVGGPQMSALQNPAFKAALSGFAYHGYTLYSRHAPYPQQLRQAAQSAHAAGKDVWMTEWSIIAQKRTPLEHALEVMQRLGRETAYIPTNYWTWWQGWYYRHPKGEVLLTGADDKHLHISKTYYVLRKLWHSAPPGSVVHRVQSDDSEIKGFDPYEVQAVAFVRPQRTTLLIVNPTPRAKTLNIRGLSGTKASLFLTTDALNMKDEGPRAVHNGATTIALPPRTIALLVATPQIFTRRK